MEKEAIVTVLLLMGCGVESVPHEMGGYSTGDCDPWDDYCRSGGRGSIQSRYSVGSLCDPWDSDCGGRSNSDPVSNGSPLWDGYDDYSGGKSKSNEYFVSNGSPDPSAFAPLLLLTIISIFSVVFALTDNATATETVLKLQVVLEGPTHTIQRELNLILGLADASTKKGLCFILSETSSRLLLRLDRCFSAHSSVNEKSYFLGNSEKSFDQICAEEHKKFDDVAPLHVCNIRERSESSQRMDRSNNEFITVTIVVAAFGGHNLPNINCRSDLENALQYLKSMRHPQSVKVLWTPRDEDHDMQTERILFEDYAHLASMKYYKN